MSKHSESGSLRRGLSERQMNLMALGAAIGVGLFLGSATAIRSAGPAILVAYGVCGLLAYVVMRALGEMAIHDPVAGSFSRYAYNYVGHRAGFLTGWTYWFYWIISIMAEVTAAAIYMHYWFPDVPSWIWALASLFSMTALNLIAVRAFGELEFWFASIKVITIVVLIVSGIGIICFGIGNGGIPTGVSNLWRHGGFAPNGVSGVLSVLPLVIFSYIGIEMLGLTAGEAKNPKQTIKRAVGSVFWRIAIFYVGALFVVLSIYPWNEIGIAGSPFVVTFEKLGIHKAAGILNFVVLTATLSACNTGIFGTARMLFNLSQQGQAPKKLNSLNKRGLPIFAIAFCVSIALFGVALNYFAPKGLFVALTAVAAFAGIFTWTSILVSHLNFRKHVKLSNADILLTGSPFVTYVALAVILGIAILMLFFDETRPAIVIGIAWTAFLNVAYEFTKSKQSPAALEVIE
ncbi:amino acid permease [Burkholderia sp. PU8-34]